MALNDEHGCEVEAGENVSVGEVEYVLLQHPAVFECAVIGITDSMRDESIVTVIVLHPGQTATAAEITQLSQRKPAAFRVPQQILFRSELPKTSVGKIQKHLIRQNLMDYA